MSRTKSTLFAFFTLLLTIGLFASAPVFAADAANGNANLKVNPHSLNFGKKSGGQPIERVAKDTDRDYYMNAAEAKEYRVVDDILNKPPAVPEDEA